MKLIPRAIAPEVRERLETQPAVVLLGPRQVGIKARKRYLVYPGQERFSLGGDVTATPLAPLASELAGS